MTKTQLERVNSDLLDAAIAALNRFQSISVTEHADLRRQLSEAITRAKTPPDRWFLLDAPVRTFDNPFDFGDKGVVGS